MAGGQIRGSVAKLLQKLLEYGFRAGTIAADENAAKAIADAMGRFRHAGEP